MKYIASSKAAFILHAVNGQVRGSCYLTPNCRGAFTNYMQQGDGQPDCCNSGSRGYTVIGQEGCRPCAVTTTSCKSVDSYSTSASGMIVVVGEVPIPNLFVLQDSGCDIS